MGFFAPDRIPKSSPKQTQPIKSQVKALTLIEELNKQVFLTEDKKVLACHLVSAKLLMWRKVERTRIITEKETKF